MKMKNLVYMSAAVLTAVGLAAVPALADTMTTPDGMLTYTVIKYTTEPETGQPVTVTLDGEEIVFPDVQPYINSKDRTLVPIRFVAEKLEAEVDWEPVTLTAVISKDGNTIEYSPLSSDALYNGYRMQFDSTGVLKGDRTLVPLRFISEMLRCKVEWDNDNQTVILSTPEEKTEFPEPRVSVHFRETPYDARLMWITLDNLLDYPDIDNYEFQLEFTDPVQFNTCSVDVGETAGVEYRISNNVIWQKLQPNSTILSWIQDGNYSDRESMRTFTPYDAMPISYTLRVKRLCCGQVREYTFTDTFKLPYQLRERR